MFSISNTAKFKNETRNEVMPWQVGLGAILLSFHTQKTLAMRGVNVLLAGIVLVLSVGNTSPANAYFDAKKTGQSAAIGGSNHARRYAESKEFSGSINCSSDGTFHLLQGGLGVFKVEMRNDTNQTISMVTVEGMIDGSRGVGNPNGNWRPGTTQTVQFTFGNASQLKRGSTYTLDLQVNAIGEGGPGVGPVGHFKASFNPRVD